MMANDNIIIFPSAIWFTEAEVMRVLAEASIQSVGTTLALDAIDEAEGDYDLAIRFLARAVAIVSARLPDEGTGTDPTNDNGPEAA